MDMVGGQFSTFGGPDTTVGEIDGEELDWNEFYRVEQTLYSGASGDPYARRDYLWNYFVEQSLVNKEANKLGLSVSKAELKDLQFGPNPSPIITQRFSNPQSPGTLDRDQLNFFRQIIEEDRIAEAIQNGQIKSSFPAFWAHQEKEIMKDRLQGKLGGLVSKAMYTPTWMAEMGHAEKNQSVQLALVKVPFDEIDNTEVSLADSDFEAFLKENEKEYIQDEETRRVTYVYMDVSPTSKDSADIRNALEEMIPEFESTDDDSLFVETNYGTIMGTFMPKEQVVSQADTIFSVPAGTVIGPFIEQNAYKVVKVLERTEIADSADTRHILVSANTPDEFVAAEKKVDSLKNVLEARLASFDSLALKFSQDPGSASKGGVYENVVPNQFVPEYNEVLFETGRIGQLYTTRTSYGVHLVEVLSRSKSASPRVKLAYLSQPIVPSKDTQDRLFEKTSATIAANSSLSDLLAAVEADPDFKVETSPSLTKNDYSVGALPSDESSRSIVKWAFNAHKDERSADIYRYQDPVENFYSKYVLAGLKSIQKPGLPSVEEIRDEIEPILVNEKKAAIITQQLQGKDMAAIASEYELTVDTVNNLRFSQVSLQPVLGNEPKVVGMALQMEEGQVSEPVAGNSGVFLFKVISKPPLSAATNLPQIKRSMSSASRSKVPVALIPSLKKESKIQDRRAKFY